MKKVIALSTVLAFGALGMACDGAPGTNNSNGNTNKPVNTSTPAPVNTATPATNMNTAPSNANIKPITNANDNKKP